MIPAIYNLPDAYRGDMYGPITLRIKDSDGNYINVMNSEVNLHVKNKKNYSIVLNWSTSDATVELSNDYTITLKEKESCKMQMPGGVYDYDLQMLKDGVMRSYLRGALSVIGDVTHVDSCYP